MLEEGLGFNPDLGEERLGTACGEIVKFCETNGIPLSKRMRGYLTGEGVKTERYGSEYTLASGHLIRTITRAEGDGSRLEVFGLGYGNQFELEGEISAELAQDRSLSDERIRDLVELEMFEIMRDPRGRYPGILKLESLADVEMSESAGLFLDLCGQCFRKLDGSGKNPSFERSNRGRYLFCSDSEFYMAARLSERIDGADSTVFFDGDKPIFFQKTGRFKTSYGKEGDGFVTNATAITLCPVEVNGIVLPSGTLVGLETNIDEGGESYVRKEGDQRYGIERIKGIMPLRLSIFAVDESEQERAFGSHYTKFKDTVEGWGGRVPVLEDFVKKAETHLIGDLSHWI